MRVWADWHVSDNYLSHILISIDFEFEYPALAKDDWSISRTRSQSRLHLSSYRKDHGLNLKGKAGFSDEYLDKLEGEGRSTLHENGGACKGEPELGWERLRLSDGNLLSSSRDIEFEKLKVIF